MANGAGRYGNFFDGSEHVREPAFHTAQVSPRQYQKTSVLDNLMPSGNGMGDPDKQRLILGVPRSSSGQSDSNFDKSLWLRAGRSPDLYKQTFGRES